MIDSQHKWHQSQCIGIAAFRSIQKKIKTHSFQSKAWHTPPLLAFLALSGFKASSSIHHEPLSKQTTAKTTITQHSTLPSCLSFYGALVWSYFFLWLLHSFWESWSNQTPWVILLIPTSTRINMDQAEKSINAPLMAFVYGRDAERHAHALSCMNSLPLCSRRLAFFCLVFPRKGVER